MVVCLLEPVGSGCEGYDIQSQPVNMCQELVEHIYNMLTDTSSPMVLMSCGQGYHLHSSANKLWSSQWINSRNNS